MNTLPFWSYRLADCTAYGLRPIFRSAGQFLFALLIGNAARGVDGLSGNKRCEKSDTRTFSCSPKSGAFSEQVEPFTEGCDRSAFLSQRDRAGRKNWTDSHPDFGWQRLVSRSAWTCVEQGRGPRYSCREFRGTDSSGKRGARYNRCSGADLTREASRRRRSGPRCSRERSSVEDLVSRNGWRGWGIFAVCARWDQRICAAGRSHGGYRASNRERARGASGLPGRALRGVVSIF